MRHVTSDLSPRPSIADIYDQGAAVYAAHWAPVLQVHARDLAGMVPLPPDGQGRTVLDVAAGAGTLLPDLRPLAGDAAAGGRLVALDYSAGMLALSDPSVARIQCDAAALPLRDDCADVAMFSFVLFLLPDARAAVLEAARVLRPGGWLLAATWGDQVGTPADDIVEDEIDAAGAPPGPDLPRSDELTDTPDRIRELIETAGFTDITTTARPLNAQFDAGSTLAMRTGSGNLGWRYSQLATLAQARVRERVAIRMAPLGREDFLDRSQVLLTTARRA